MMKKLMNTLTKEIKKSKGKIPKKTLNKLKDIDNLFKNFFKNTKKKK